MSGEEGDEAALALGLLVERERVRRPLGQDGGLRLILGDSYADHRLTEREFQKAVDGLSQYIDNTPHPQPLAVWALGKSYDERIVPILTRLVDRLLMDSEMDDTTYETLTALANLHTAEAIQAIVKAAESGTGKSQEFALSYLRLFGSP